VPLLATQRPQLESPVHARARQGVSRANWRTLSCRMRGEWAERSTAQMDGMSLTQRDVRRFGSALTRCIIGLGSQIDHDRGSPWGLLLRLF
jgi:hypothetical protein